jgi:hypothetical protein
MTLVGLFLLPVYHVPVLRYSRIPWVDKLLILR